MSTRANIILKETYSYKDAKGNEVTNTESLIFYRHSDGYPEGAMPTLNIFLKWLQSGKIRNNVSQGGGWLILLGAMEYNTLPEFITQEPHFKGGKRYGDTDTIKDPSDWKCGAYEPTTDIAGDIEYLYIIDMGKMTIQCFDTWTDAGEGINEVTLAEME